jgi:hypothetical protein
MDDAMQNEENVPAEYETPKTTDEPNEQELAPGDEAPFHVPRD